MTADRSPLSPTMALGMLALFAAGLAAANIAAIADANSLLSPFSGDLGERERLLLHYAFLPRLAVSLLCGAALGLAGVLFQQVLQNPQASPTTLGVSAGAQLSLTLALILAPAFHARHSEAIALAGAFAAWALILVLAGRRRSDAMTLILTGFVASYALGAIATSMLLLDQEYLASLFIWGAGSLAQGDWDSVSFLAIRLAGCAVLIAFCVRPLQLLGFGDETARGLGVSLSLIRPLVLGLAIFLSAITVSVVGVIGFIGLAAPHVATLLGAQRLWQRLAVAPIAGALLLLAIDQILQLLAGERATLLPTGAVTALLGAPLLILLLWRVRNFDIAGASPVRIAAYNRKPSRPLLLLLASLALALGLAAAVGNAPDGWAVLSDLRSPVLEWRVPRVLAAAAGGFALGIAGCLAQRLFANPMASPEVLGVGGGVAMGLIAVMLMSPAAGKPLQLAGATAGALAVMTTLLVLGGRRQFSAQRLLLMGIAVTALLDASTLTFLALGDPRAAQLLAFLSGSTYGADMQLGLAVALVAAAAFVVSLLLARWLDILPLGPAVAKGLGVPLGLARCLILLLASATTAAAAIIVGPMSFAGLLSPHIAALLGLRRAAAQLVGSAMIGALIVVVADWIGRTLFAPTELPAGIIASLIGATFMVTALLGPCSRKAAP